MDGLLKYLAEFGAPRSEETISKLATGNPLMLAKAARNRAEVGRAQISDLMNYPQDWSQFGQNLAKAYPTSSPEAVRQAAYQAAVNAGPLMTVWQGSPHKFAPTKNNPLGEFDASKIGSGEGAQAYGYGHYLAESPSVAKGYQKTLAPERNAYDLNTRMTHLRVGDKPVTTYGIDNNAELIDAAKQGPKAALDLMDAEMARWARLAEDQSYPFREYAKEKMAAYGALKADAAAKGIAYTGSGHLYKVDLPDDQIAKMLDWDKPLSQQPESVRKAFAPIVAPIRAEMAKPAGAGWGEFAAPQKFDPTGHELLALIRQQAAPMNAQSVLGNGLGPEVSQRLRALGIPGIRYLDGGSRSGGQGTSNFVVFPGNEGILKILGRE